MEVQVALQETLVHAGLAFGTDGCGSKARAMKSPGGWPLVAQEPVTHGAHLGGTSNKKQKKSKGIFPAKLFQNSCLRGSFSHRLNCLAAVLLLPVLRCQECFRLEGILLGCTMNLSSHLWIFDGIFKVRHSSSASAEVLDNNNPEECVFFLCMYLFIYCWRTLAQTSVFYKGGVSEVDFFTQLTQTSDTSGLWLPL